MEKQIYRSGGTITWDSTFRQLLKQCEAHTHNNNKPIVVRAAGPGMGKSTLLETWANYFNGIVIEGDILAVVALHIHHGIEIPIGATMAQLGRGEIKDKEGNPFNPWASERPSDERMTEILDKNLFDVTHKIRLCTAYHGMRPGLNVVVVPNYEFYKHNLDLRREAMIKDYVGKNDEEYVARFNKEHATMSQDDFNAAHDKLFMKLEGKTMILVPNNGLSEFQACSDAMIPTAPAEAQ